MTAAAARCRARAGDRPTPEAALVDHGETRFEQDPWAVEIARRGGAPPAIVAAALAITRERVRQIEAAALKKLIPRLALVGIGRDDIARVLAERPGAPYVESPAPSMPVSADARERHRAANRAHMARKREQARAAGAYSPGYVPVERLPEGAWSEHGQRVEAALAAAEVAVARAELASLRDAEVAG